ncbi:GntR family transcriptional regulator [Bosea sp. (in: a-proteobacteria)]|uniref:GntR family transcriptional regulator n=1 Tax=Bosea sp. (in: a-proteobacteria) TaxID=1871050 RepID=UPI002FC85C76
MTSEAGTSGEAAEAYPRIQRRTLHDEVLERLRDMIIEGRFAPGQRINEGLVGAQLGVSRTPLREAIKTLASEGLVEIQPAKGAIVRKFTAQDLLQILEVLKALEQLGGRTACAQASDAAIAAIKALHDAMMELYRTRNRLEYFKLNQAIHSAVVAASGNDVLVEMHATLQARIKRLRFIGNEGPEKWAGAVAEHEEMIEALTKRDGEALAAAIGKHMDSTLVRVRGVL